MTPGKKNTGNGWGQRFDEAHLLIALEAFRKAGAGGITPSELGGVLREVTADFRPPARPQTEREQLLHELIEFVELDLSDYAFSLAIHDSRALEKFQDRVKQLAGRLEREARARSGDRK
jgi:hypothetical protein